MRYPKKINLNRRAPSLTKPVQTYRHALRAKTSLIDPAGLGYTVKGKVPKAYVKRKVRRRIRLQLPLKRSSRKRTSATLRTRSN